MKLSAFLILCFSLNVYSKTFSQKVNLNVKNVSLVEVFKIIENQTDINFVYTEDLMKNANLVTIRIENEPLKIALDKCFFDQPFKYTIVKNVVIINTKDVKEKNIEIAPSSIPDINLPPPPIPIKGKITDQNGKALPKASVLVKGTQYGTTTDENGEFSLNVKNESAVLIISYVGYEDATVSIKGKSSITISLKVKEEQAQDVIIVGYGKDTRQKITSSVSTLKTDEFVNAPYTDVQSALQGRVAGVQVYPSGGEPGSVPTIQIRGGEPLIGQTTPLYVIDGLVKDQNAFVALNVNDIASISFLKDAAATAVYGSQASAGIILVTTKQGQVGKMQLTYSDNLAWNTPINFPKLVNSYQKAVMSNLFAETSGSGQYSVYSPAQLDTIKNHLNLSEYPDVDWYNLCFKKYTMQQKHDIDITGGNEKSKYYIGLGYFHQGSNYVNDAEKLDRFSYRSNFTSTFDKIGLDVTMSINGYYSYQTAPPAGAWSIFSHIVAQSPLTPAYNSNGTIYGTVGNPLAEIYSPGYDRNEILYNDGTLTFNWRVPWIKGLQLAAIGDYNFTYNPSKIFTALASEYNPDGSSYALPAPTLSQSQSNSSSYNLEFHLNYVKSIAKHHLEGTLISNTRAGKNNWYSASRGNFPSTAIDQMSAGDASTQTNSGSATEWGNVGYVGRIKYDYDGKYLLEVNGRYDGSDYFPPGKRFGFFPSLSLGYAISKENFYKKLNIDKVFNFLKWRGSIGTTGSIGGTKYAYVPQYNVNTQVFVANGQLQNGYSEGALTINNQNITWYSTRSYDWGIDFATLKSHLNGSFDYFFTRSTNILGSSNYYSYTAPLGQTLPSVLTNAATRKEGVDFNITYKNAINKNINYYIGFNFTYYNYLWERSQEDSVTLSNPYIRQQGVIQTYYGSMYLSNGLYQNWNQILNNPSRLTSTALTLGDIWLVDANGDGQINSQDFRNTGHQTNARFLYGINFGINYKGLSLDALINGSGRRDVYLGSYLEDPGEGRDNFVFQYDAWTENNTNAGFPRVTSSAVNSGNNFTSNNFWLINAQYVRLKNVTIAYELNKVKAIRKTQVFKELSAFVSGTNLLTFSKCKKYFDPELADTNNFFYPVNKTYSLGVRVGF